MSAAVVVGAILAVAAVLLVALPFLREPVAADDRLDARTPDEERRLALVEERDQVLAALKELEFDHRTGKIGDDDYRQVVGPLRRAAANALRALDAGASSGRAPSGQAPSGQAPSGQAPSGQAPSGQARYGPDMTDTTMIEAPTPAPGAPAPVPEPAPPPDEGTPPTPAPVPEPYPPPDEATLPNPPQVPEPGPQE